MKLYSSDRQLSTFNNLIYLNEGGCAKVYRCGDLFIHPTIIASKNNSFYDDMMNSLTDNTFFETMIKRKK